MRLLQEQLESSRRHTPVELWSHAGAALLLAAVVYVLAPMQAVLSFAWAGSAAATAAAVAVYRRTRYASAHELTLFLVWRAFAAVQWSAAAWLVAPAWPEPLIALANGLVLVLSAVLLTARVVHLPGFVLFAVPVFASLSLRLALLGTDLHLTLACLDLLALAAILILARRLALLAGRDAMLRNRSRELEQRLQWTTRAVREHEVKTHREEALARQVFDRLTRQRVQASPEIKRWARAAGSFSGDLLLQSHSPCGSLNVLLADFSGHGLPAALGAIPLSAVFHTMTRKGHSPAVVAGELNLRLAEMLPVDYFCCATLLRIAPDRRSMDVCNAGMPPLLILDGRGEIKARHHSTLLPLGIVASDAAPEEPVTALEPGEVIYLFSDGLIESHNLHGEHFGLARLESQLRTAPAADSRVDRIKSAVVDFIGVVEPDDDISLIELYPERVAAPALAATAT